MRAPGLSSPRFSWARPWRARSGFSLVDVLLAILILGLAGTFAVRALSGTSSRTQVIQQKTTALTLAQSTAERIRARGPGGYTTAGDVYRVRADGTRDPSGEYLVTVVRRVRGARQAKHVHGRRATS